MRLRFNAITGQTSIRISFFVKKWPEIPTEVRNRLEENLNVTRKISAMHAIRKVPGDLAWRGWRRKLSPGGYVGRSTAPGHISCHLKNTFWSPCFHDVPRQAFSVAGNIAWWWLGWICRTCCDVFIWGSCHGPPNWGSITNLECRGYWSWIWRASWIWWRSKYCWRSIEVQVPYVSNNDL